MKRTIRLRGISGEVKGKTWESSSLLRAGRLASLEIVLDDSSVSRRHAEVRLGDDGWFVRDLESTNGTYVNGVRIGPGDQPLRPRDIVRTRSGKTVEIGNTDAEGRLILCDALWEAQAEQPELLVDVATLTGAARVALGTDLQALFCDDDATAQALHEAGMEAGDPLWRLPIWKPYLKHLEGEIADLKKAGSFKFGGFPECKTRNTCFVGYTKAYGITNASFLPLAGISAYAALDAGKVLAADVFSTDPPLGKGSKYTVLADPKHVTGFQNVAPIVKTSVAKALGPKFASTVNAVSAKLTLPAIVAMNKAVEVDKQSAASVAKAFLKANGLA